MSEFDEVVDFVAVGSGGGALCAGLMMRSIGKEALILEKTELVGGTTARSGGVMWIPDNPFLKRDGIEDSYEKAATYLEALCGDSEDAPASTRERRHTYLREAPRMVDFLLNQGIKLDRVPHWPDYYDEQPGGVPEGRTVVAELFNVKELGEWQDRLYPGFLQVPAKLDEAMQLPYLKRSWRIKGILLRIIGRAVAAKLTGKHLLTGGAALQGRMIQAALKAGVDIRPESPVDELIVEDGEVKGVVTVKDGKPWRVGARLGVLVNAGGFARNQAMRDKYQPGTSADWTNVSPGDTGEMIQEMMRHGAAIAQMEEMVGYQTTLPPGSENDEVKPTAQRLTAGPHAILVDQSGVRYMNEGGSYMAYCKRMLERNKEVPAVPSWAVFDSQHMNNYMVAGTMPGKKKPQSWYDEGYLKQGETIEELASAMGADPQKLKETVERFNGFVDKGHDEDFQRGERAYDRFLGDPTRPAGPLRTLGSIEKPPFFAVPVLPGDVSTYGGVVTDEHSRVLREDGTPIPGLYATGVSTASVMGRIYPGAGGSIGPAFTWGYLAARHAADPGEGSAS